MVSIPLLGDSLKSLISGSDVEVHMLKNRLACIFGVSSMLVK